MAKVEQFNKYSDIYENWFETNKYVYESELQAVKSLLPINGKSIEIGVGSGRFAEPLEIKIGVEPSDRMREIAQNRGIEVFDGVAEDLPFDNNQFDFALMVTTICFLDDVEKALNEASRILRPGGSIVIGFIDKNSQIGKFYQKHKHESVFYSAATFYSVKEIINYLKKAGFRDLTYTQTIFHNLKEIKEIEPIKKGYGKGSFVVIRGMMKIKIKSR